jgi:hypothetical protein
MLKVSFRIFIVCFLALTLITFLVDWVIGGSFFHALMENAIDFFLIYLFIEIDRLSSSDNDNEGLFLLFSLVALCICLYKLKSTQKESPIDYSFKGQVSEIGTCHSDTCAIKVKAKPNGEGLERVTQSRVFLGDEVECDLFECKK